MAFSTGPEIATLKALQAALGDLGYQVSQKTRVLDVIRAVAEATKLSTNAGPSLGAQVIPALRAAAGPLNKTHPWLQPGDWSYAFSAHFDFVVRAPLDERHPTHPLFAVEFDGPRHHEPAMVERDLRKNWLCLAAQRRAVRDLDRVVGALRPRRPAPRGHGMVSVDNGYPIRRGEPEPGWDAFANGRLPYLAASLFFGASGFIGAALCHYNLLHEVHLAVKVDELMAASQQQFERGGTRT